MRTITQLLFDEQHTGSAKWHFPAEEKSIPVSALTERVKAFAKVLEKQNIGKGDRVGFVLENSFDLVCLLYATWCLNAVAVPLRSRSGRYQDYRSHIEKCDGVCHFNLIIYEGESISEEMSSWSIECGKSVLPLEKLVDEVDGTMSLGNLVPATISPQDVAIIQFSSGSTGDPKGVVVTHSMMMAQLQNIEDNHARSRGGRVASSASWLPINHDMGLFIGVLSPIFSACDNLLSSPAYYMKNPPRWFELLSKYRVDFTFSTNSVLASSLNTLRRLRRSPEASSPNQPWVDLSKLHVYIAAEKVSPIIVRRAWESLSVFGCPKQNIHVGYGMAENTLGATYTTAGPIKMHWFIINQDNSLELSGANNSQAFELASIGVANDDHTITIRDRQGAALPELTLGELCIESPCVSPAYYNDPRQTEVKLKDGLLKTGDFGFKFNGEFYFYSRIDDLIISGGRNVVPDDIEGTVESLDFVRPGSSVLLGLEDAQTGILQLHLLIEGNALMSEEDMQAQTITIRQHILDVHDLLLKNISLCTKGSIEKTSSGKKRRKVIGRRLSNAQIIFLPLEGEKAKNKLIESGTTRTEGIENENRPAV